MLRRVNKMKSVRNLFTDLLTLFPSITFQTKEVIRERERAKYTLKNLPTGLTQSWQQYMLKKQYEDFCHCVAQVCQISMYLRRRILRIKERNYYDPSKSAARSK